MAKITDFEFAGSKGNLFQLGDITKLVLGAFVFLSTFALGQNLFKKAGTVVPKFDATIEPIQTEKVIAKSSAKRYV